MPSAAADAPAGCLFSWGGGEEARGWRGHSTGGVGPAQRPGWRSRFSHEGSPGPDAIAVAASRNSLALGQGGQVLTWGRNDSRGGGDAYHVRGRHSHSILDSGQLGRTGADSWTPAPISTGALTEEGARSIASGRYHALAAGARTGAVYTWGLNDHGQLGREGWGGRAAVRRCDRGQRCRDGMPRTAPALSAPRLPAAVSVAAGRYFSVAVTADGRAYAWGRCACGRPDAATLAASPADGKSLDTAVPYAMGGGGLERERVVGVAAGYAHLLLLTSTGAVFSCETGDDGYGGRLAPAPRPNAFGQLGREGAPLVPARIAPSALGTLGPPRLIAAGRCASFAVDTQGVMRAWGCAQGSGHPPPDRRAPETLASLVGWSVRSLAAGEYHAVASNGTAVRVWGAGAGSAEPVTVAGLPPAAAVLSLAAGYQHSLAVVACSGTSDTGAHHI